jgi:Flp pilus assembly pilin Flp
LFKLIIKLNYIMKKILLFILLPLLSIGQTKIGADIDAEASGDANGSSVSVSSDGSIVAIGATRNNGSGVARGSVRVYKNISGTWTQIGADIDGEVDGDTSGNSVSLSSDGSIVAIGADANSGNNGNLLLSGSVRVYKNISGTWTQIGADIDGEANMDFSGHSVSLSSDGSIVAIGAVLNDGSGTDAGSVRVYKNILGTWTQIGADIDGEAAGDHSGGSVSLSSDGSIVAIGADQNDGSGTNAGSVRVYKNISGTWTKIGADIDTEASGDSNGSSVSLSSDGSIVAIGAGANDGSGTDAGSVRVYKNISGTWTQIGADIDGEAAGDYSGWSVSLSSDGSIVAIGAYGNDGSGTDAGSVRIYKNISGNWTQIGADIDGDAADNQSGRVSLSSDGSIVAIGATGKIGGGSVSIYNLSAVLSSDSFVLAHFSVYPNPASELVTISLEKGLTLEKVNIYNTLGQLLKTENKNVIAVNSLAKGNYFFEVITNKGKATKKIIVQ